MAVVGAGTRCPVIGANGEEDGFRRIARRTGTTGAGAPMEVGKALTVNGVLTAAGEARTGAGAGPTTTNNRSPKGSPSDRGRVLSSVSDTSVLWAINVPRDAGTENNRGMDDVHQGYSLRHEHLEPGGLRRDGAQPHSTSHGKCWRAPLHRADVRRDGFGILRALCGRRSN
jgi:hypothetical protein